MFTFNMIEGMLRESAIRIQINPAHNLTIKNIVLLYPDNPATEEQTVYVGTAEILAQALAGWNGVSPRMLIISAPDGGTDAVDIYLREDTVSYLVSPLPIPQIGNYLMSAFFRFQQWCDRIRQGIYQRQNLPSLLKQMVECTQTPIFWLNSGYRLLASNVSYAFEDEYIQELIFHGHLSSSSVESLLRKSKQISLLLAGNSRAFLSTPETGHLAVICEVRERHTFLGQFMLIYDDPQRSHTILDMTRVLASFFLLYASAEDGRRDCHGNMEGYTDLLIDLIEKKLKNRAELASRMNRLKPPMTDWYRCLVIGLEPSGVGIPETHLLQKFAAALPDSVIFQYDHDIAVMLRLSGAEDTFSQDKLKAVLENCHAYACVGAKSRFLTSFRAIFLQTQACLHLGMKFARPQGKRIFLADDYHMHFVISLCAKQAVHYHEGNLIYLCSPQYTALLRYDRTHGDNLCEIMKAYFRNNCNTSQTAKVLFLHRNTLINKLTKIEEIIGASLDDFQTRIRLIFSDMVMEYADICCREDPLLLKDTWKAPVSPSSPVLR